MIKGKNLFWLAASLALIIPSLSLAIHRLSSNRIAPQSNVKLAPFNQKTFWLMLPNLTLNQRRKSNMYCAAPMPKLLVTVL